MTLDDARTLAGYYALREYLEGRALPPPEARAKIDALLHPFVPLDGLLMPVLQLDEAIAELEKQLPAIEAARAAHLTRAEPALVCRGEEAQPGVAEEVSHEKIGQA